MKIAKSKLIQMIKEEMIKEDDEWVDVSKLKSQAEHGPYAEDEFKKDMETTLSRVVSDELSFEAAMEEFNGFLDKYKPSEDPWDEHPDPEAFSFDEDELYSGPEDPEGRVPGQPKEPEEETIEISEERKPKKYQPRQRVKNPKKPEWGVGTVTAVDPGPKGSVSVIWPDGKTRGPHHRWTLRPAND